MVETLTDLLEVDDQSAHGSTAVVEALTAALEVVAQSP